MNVPSVCGYVILADGYYSSAHMRRDPWSACMERISLWRGAVKGDSRARCNHLTQPFNQGIHHVCRQDRAIWICSQCTLVAGSTSNLIAYHDFAARDVAMLQCMLYRLYTLAKLCFKFNNLVLCGVCIWYWLFCRYNILISHVKLLHVPLYSVPNSGSWAGHPKYSVSYDAFLFNWMSSISSSAALLHAPYIQMPYLFVHKIFVACALSRQNYVWPGISWKLPQGSGKTGPQPKEA